MGLSSWLQAIIFLSCWELIHASNLSACSDKKDPQPIAINLSLDAVTAICVPSLDQTVLLAAIHPRSVASPLPKYARSTSLLRSNYHQERYAKSRRPSGLLSKLYSLRDALFASKSPLPTDINREPSPDQIREGFLEAFERVKNVSSEETGTNIVSAVVFVPRFLSHEVQRLVIEASEEAGIRPILTTSPDKILSKVENILDRNITSITSFDVAVHPQKLLIVDYGLWYFDVQTHGRRCKLNYPIDSMGCMSIPYRLLDKLNSTNVDIQQQLDQGASYNPLVAAIYQTRALMKEYGGVNSLGQEASERDMPEKWPLDLDDWWIGPRMEAFITWDDIKTVEAEYISDLAETLDRLLLCLEEAKIQDPDKSDEVYSTFDKVIILGNSCDRPIIRQAVRQSVGEHATIIGGMKDSDFLLEALAGARMGFKIHESAHHIEEDQDPQQIGGHEEL